MKICIIELKLVNIVYFINFIFIFYMSNKYTSNYLIILLYCNHNI